MTREPLLSFRVGANAVRRELVNLQIEYGLTDLQMVSILNEHQRDILSDLIRHDGGTGQ